MNCEKERLNRVRLILQ